MKIEGFKEDVNENIASERKVFEWANQIVEEKRLLELFSLPTNCYSCRKPLNIDLRYLLKNHKLNDTHFFCEKCSDDVRTYNKDILFIRHKNFTLQYIRHNILERSFK